MKTIDDPATPGQAEPARSLTDLTPEQRALLMLRLRQKAAQREEPQGPVLRPLPRAAADGAGVFPLSFAQQRLWFVDQWQPRSPAYNIPIAIRARGRLDREALRWCFDEVVRRHESLRTGFRVQGDQPVQVIRAAEPLPVPEVDLMALPEGARAAESRRLAEESSLRPFDLAHDRLLRVTLVHLAPEDHAVLVCMHHIVSDGWSISIFVQEFAALYGAHVQGLPSPLPELEIQYADFAAWQREWLHTESLEAQLDYWRQALAGIPEAIELPLSHPRPAVRSARGRRASYSLPPELVLPVKALAQREGATLFMVLLAALDTLLHRYSGERDIVVGTPVAGRNRAELEPVIGFFVNNLVLRNDLSGDPTFRELVGRVRESTLGAQSHPDVPFERLVEELRPERDLSRPPLYQVVFTMQNTPDATLVLSDLSLIPLPFETGTAKNDLLLSVAEGNGWAGGHLEYSLDLFDEAAAQRIVGHYRALLEGIAEDAERPLSELPLLAEAERWQLLTEWNDTAADLPAGGFRELWGERVERWADHPAVASGVSGESLTYRELDRRADLLAEYLRGLGVGPEVLVGVLMERSVEVVVTMLALWKAGGVYVPLDPTYPEERLAAMLEDTSLAIVLTHGDLASRLPWSAAFVVAVDAEWDRIALGSGEPFESGALPENLAYVIFTSGSTGRPKGVMIQYGGFNVLGLAQERLFGPGGGERLLLFAPLAFDTAIFDWMLALWRGNTLYLAGPEELLPGPALVRLLEREAITSLTLTPSALSALPEAELPALRRLWVAGEALPPELVARWWQPERRFYNGYGPTETTIWVSTETCDDSGRVPPIGRPAANKRTYILDGRMRPVPVGGVGELYVGGAGLARGYLHRPDLTAERFVPDPFSSPEEAGARLYRTGDLTRQAADGKLLFVGRNDHQVKIRGFRIELGEIEAVLGRHPAVREAAVVVQERKGDTENGDRRLAAFFVPREGSELTPDELRAHLRERLPDFMVPATFTPLEALPLTPNDKVDRRALTALDPAAARTTQEFLAPRNPVEDLLALILAEVLGLERVGVRDGFFDLGGHSLLATQVLSRVREAFGVEIALASFFEQPTVEGLSAWVQGTSAVTAAATVAPLEAQPRQAGDPLSFAQQRLWFLQQLDPESAAYNIPGAVRLAGSLDVAALSRSLSEIVRRHEVLRTSFPEDAGRPVQAVAPWQPEALPVVDLAGLPEAARETEVRQLGTEMARQPFDLGQGPLLCLVLIAAGADDHVLLYAMHHIVSDGWSMGILIGELAKLYRAFQAGEPSPLAELPVQYADFARWQREWLQGGVLEAQLAYWRERLAGVPPVLALPTDRPRPAVAGLEGAGVGITLDAELVAALESLSRRRGATLFMTLLAGLEVLLARLAGQRDFCVGTPIAGRNRLETEGLIGFFVNTLVLRSDLVDGPALGELLARVRGTALGAYAHQDLPFEQLVEEVQPERDLAGTPLFQVMFALQNAPSQALDLPGLTLAPVPVEMGAAKFDLDLQAVPADVAGGGLGLWAVYRTDLFDGATVERWLGHFRTVLQAIAEDSERQVFELPLLTAAEREQILVDWNRTDAEFPRESMIHELFAEQAERRPAAVAVECGDVQWTYRELRERAGRLARHLRALGVGEGGDETRVGLLTVRSASTAAGLLGILEAGGAYMPLEPSHPTERIEYVLRDAGTGVLLADRRLVEGPDAPHAGATANRRVVFLDDEAGWQPQAEIEPWDDSRRLAYVTYTSGSTGRPKGVAISHRNVMRLVRAAEGGAAHAELAPERTFLQFAPVAFDLSTLEIWGPLLSGGRLVLYPGDKASLEELGAAISRHGVDSLWLTSGLFQQMVDHQLESLRPLRQLLAGGDVVSAAHARRVLEELPGIVLVNGYGPTEGTTFLCSYRMTGPEQVGLSTPIGGPIANTTAYVLDRELRPVPVGVAGELYGGGEGLARGYHGRPELTAEKFVPDPFGDSWGRSGERLYRTGDLVRWRPDGLLEFLGRDDDQVKIRGFRVEPGEVEAALNEHPAVLQAAVSVVETARGKSLAAYVVPAVAGDAGDADLVAELRGSLRTWLPEAMVPSAWRVLDSLPLLSNGKLDRRALARLAADGAGGAELLERDLQGSGAEASDDPVAGVVAAIWCEILGLDRVGLHESFFDLGGHSLLGTQVISRVRTSLGAELPLRALFEAPTVAGLSTTIAERLRAQGGQAAPPIVPVPRTAEIPLSFSQERLWFIEQLQPGTAAYHIPTAIRLLGPLDADALGNAVDAVAARHETLRTWFAIVDGRPVQAVDPPRAGLLERLDVSASADPERAVGEIVERETARPFDLAGGGPFRAVLVKVGEGDHIALLVLHHIATDAWSMGILMRELAAFYADPQAELPPLPVQYPDFAVWQRHWLAGEELERQLGFWRQRLEGAPAVLALPLDRTRPPVQTFRGDDFGAPLSPELSAALRDRSRRSGTTLFMTLLAGFDALLHRLTGETDVVVGVPSANRNRAEIEGLIGFFVNSLALRADLAGEPSFGELLGRVRETTLAAYTHQDLPFEKLVAELSPERHLSHSPLFQVMFQLQHMQGTPPLALPGIEAGFLGADTATAAFDLVLDFRETGGALVGGWRFNTDLFDRASVERMAGQLAVLLAGAAADPERRIADLPFLTEAERHQLLLEWNLPAGPEPAAVFPELFEAQAARTPDAPALVGEAGTLTYAELAGLARRGARLLAAQGVGPDSIVALLAPRGPELIAAILAVQQAGGAWLPLDPAQPEKRLAAIIAEAGVTLVVAGEGAPALSLPSLLSLSSLLAAPSDSEPSPALPAPQNLAYLISTSGSTGVPKSVMVEHRGMLNHILAKIADLGLTAADTVAQTASQTFDISVWQSLAALLVGGKVRVYPDEVVRDPGRLVESVDRDGVTVLEIVPSLLAGVLEVLPEPRPALPALRWLVSTGEALPPELARRWLATYPEVPLLNAYGPSEASDRVSHHWLESPPAVTAAMTSIGRPIANLRLHVLDGLERGLSPLPVGVAGNLAIGGTGVGRGYRRDPARTAEAFVPDPAAGLRGEPGARLYLTGDLARFLADGTLEFLGRRDHQVKIRGFRIEIGEVETALRALPGVRQAVVAVRGNRLVSYAVPKDPAVLAEKRAEELAEELAASWKAALAESLPSYMVPAAFVVLEALPLSRNGKVDRKALPDPAQEESRDLVLPGTPFELLLAAMWREAVGLPEDAPIGAHDNFFELGGDSIKGAIFANRLERRLGEEVLVAMLFESPTLAELARAVAARYPEAVARLTSDDGEEGFSPEFAALWEKAGEALGDLDLGTRLSPMERRSREAEAAPLSFAQERLWFLHQLDPEGAAYNMPQVLRLTGPLDVAALGSAFAEVLRRHEALRTRFPVHDGRPVQAVEPVPDRVLTYADLTGLGEESAAEAQRLAAAESSRPFDLQDGPVVRNLLLRVAPEDHLLVFVSHHIACDGWSMGLWGREIEALYNAFVRREPSPLPEPPVQYADFAAWQRSWLQGAALEAQVAYWRERLRAAPAYLELPLDRPRPAFQTTRGAAESFFVSGELMDRLRSLSTRSSASLFMTLLAAFQLHLKRLSGQDDVLVGSPIAGRTRPELEGLIGCFLNTLVLRTDLSGAPTFLELLRRTRETALGAFSYQDVPFEKLLEELRPERDTSRPSLFQVLFNMLNAPGGDLALPSLQIDQLGAAEPLAKFDLTLYVAEQHGGLVLQLVYNADLFDRPRMRDMLRQYHLLLEQIAADPDAAIDRYELLTREAAAVLPDPAASLAHPWPGAVQDLFAEWARRTPGKIALSDRDGDWTYGELDDAVKRLAARLWADGVRPGDRVAIYAHRSAALAWALLGVLKAGAAFTILDPIYPAPRLIDRLKMAEPRGLLHLEGAGPLPAELEDYVASQDVPCRLLLPAGGRERATAPVLDQTLPDDGAWPQMGAYDMASVAFTSGSTGLPKGIVQTHGSMSYFLPWHQEELGFIDADRHTMLSGLAHDPLHRDTFYCLGTGATLYVPDPDRIGEPGYLAGWMKERRVTVTNMTPAMGRLLTESGGGAPSPTLPRADARERAPSAHPERQLPQLADLRCVILAGDLLTREVVAQIRRLAPRAVFLNVYGATESQRALSFHIVEDEKGRRLKQSLPLGKGKTGSQLLILTPAGLRAGIGELGEVVIRSPHLARGYLKDEEQNRLKFATNPFTGEEGDRIYRTGDLGRYLPDGDVEAAGRADQQVKIRGFRVEPGEIEAELLRAPGVKEAVVVARTLPSEGDRQLVAYVVLDRDHPAGIPELRERLRQSLPAYMVPAAWVALEKLPVNPNGKIDRLALPSPEAAALGPQRTAVPPRDELELRLARIWEEVLGTSPVGVTDDFFDLGGHSLLAVRLMARIEGELKRSLPLPALFQSGTVEGLASLLRHQDAGTPAESSLVVLQRGQTGEDGSSRPPLFLVHPVGGQVISYLELVRLLGPDQPVYGLQDVAPPEAPRSLSGLAAGYLEQVRAAQPEGPYRLAGWSFGGRVAFEMARQLHDRGEEVAFLGMIDTGFVVPADRPPGDAQDDAALLQEVLVGVAIDVEALRRTGDPVGALVEEGKRTGALPLDYSADAARRLLEVLKAHLAVSRTNRPQPYPGRLTFFSAQEAGPGEVFDPAADPTHGWGALAGAVEVVPIPGNHVTLIRDPGNVRVLAGRLAEALERVQALELSPG